MKADYYKLLKEYIQFPSISTNPSYKKDIENCHDRLIQLFKDHDLEVESIKWYWNPIIIASYQNNIEQKTWIVYWHYDVQSASKDEWWKDDPFILFMWKDKLIARGIVDNKWQTLIHIVSILKLIKENKLNYNIKFILEWEEEIGSEWISEFIKENPDNIKWDFILISDWNLIDNTPTIESGFRWWFNAQLEIQTANTDLHTWIFGDIIPNSAQELNKLLWKLYDINNKITIPYFYYDTEDININQKSINRKIPFNQEKIKKDYDIKHIRIKDIDYYTKTWFYPCAEITWISSGYTKYFKNAIPNKAIANINFRIVPNQKYEFIKNNFEKRVKDNTPDYVNLKIFFDPSTNPIKLNLENYYIKKAYDILEKVYGKKPIYTRSWWSLPIIWVFQQYVCSKILSIPLANQDCNMHGVNENFDIELIEKWLEFSYKFFAK